MIFCTCQICGSVCAIHGAHNPEVLSLNGSVLTMAALAWIADILQRNGEVHVKNCCVQADTPIVKELGFRVVREEHDGHWLTSIETLPKEQTPE